MSAEIYTKNMLNINGEDYEAGDTISHIRWKLDDETESEVHDAYIMDITESSIIVYTVVENGLLNDVEINLDDIIC